MVDKKTVVIVVGQGTPANVKVVAPNVDPSSSIRVVAQTLSVTPTTVIITASDNATLAVGAAAGTSTVSATGRSTFSGVGAASGTGTSSAAGSTAATVVSGAGAASGTSTIAAVGTGIKPSPFSATGTSTVSATGASTAASTAAASGTGTGASPKKHRYWRLLVSAPDGSTATISITELEMQENPYGPNVIGSGTATASTALGGYPATEATDGNSIDTITSSGSTWASSTASNEWLQYDFGAGNEKFISAVGIHGRVASFANQNPRDFSVQWSDDASAWTTAWTVTGATGWGDQEFRRFVNPTYAYNYLGSPWGTHTYWRMLVHRSEAANPPCMAELEFRASVGGAQQATGGTPTASSQFSGSYIPSNAFDGNASTAWSALGSTNEWLQYQFASPVAVGQIAIKARNDTAVATSPQNFSIQFADSPSGPWATTFKKIGETGWVLGETRTYRDPSFITIDSTIAAATGTSSVAAAGQSVVSSVGAATGVGSAASTGLSIVSSVGSASGTGTQAVSGGYAVTYENLVLADRLIALWGIGAVTYDPISGTGPLGEEAFRTIETTATDNHQVDVTNQPDTTRPGVGPIAAGEYFTYSAYVKPIGERNLLLKIATQEEIFVYASASFDLQLGTVIATDVGMHDFILAGIEPAEGGYWRIWIALREDSHISTLYGAAFFLLGTQGAGYPVTYAGDGTSGLEIWSRQINHGVGPAPYIASGYTWPSVAECWADGAAYGYPTVDVNRIPGSEVFGYDSGGDNTGIDIDTYTPTPYAGFPADAITELSITGNFRYVEYLNSRAYTTPGIPIGNLEHVTFSVYVKPVGDERHLRLSLQVINSFGPVDIFVDFDLVGMTPFLNLATSSMYFGGAEIVDAGVDSAPNGWTRIWVSFYVYHWFDASLDAVTLHLLNAPSDTADNFTSDGTTVTAIWGMQLNPGDAPAPYLYSPLIISADAVSEGFTDITRAFWHTQENLFYGSEEIGGASTIDLDATLSFDVVDGPFTTGTADVISEGSGTATEHEVIIDLSDRPPVTGVMGDWITVSAYVKQISGDRGIGFGLWNYDGTNFTNGFQYYYSFDGTYLGGNGGGINDVWHVADEAAPNGYSRISFSVQYPGAFSLDHLRISLFDKSALPATVALAYDGDGASSVAITGIQVNHGIGFATYERTFVPGFYEGVAESTGTSTANAFGTTAGNVGTAAGTSTAAATGRAINSSVGAASGTGTSTTVSAATKTATAAASGTSTVTATGRSTAASTGASSGTGTQASTAVSFAAATAAASGTSTVTGTGRSTFSATASASGTGALSTVGRPIAAAVASASGTSTVSAVGQSTSVATGASSGLSTVSSVGASTASSSGASSGTGIPTSTGAATFSGLASASGAGSTLIIGTGIFEAAGSAQAVGSLTFLGQYVLNGVGFASGTGFTHATAELQGSTAEASTTSTGAAATAYLYSLHPDGLLQNEGWTDQAGGPNAWLAVDEETPDDSDFARSPYDPVASSVEFSVGDPALAIGEEIYVEYRYGKEGNTPLDIRVNLRCEGNVIASWYHANVSTSYTTVSQSLSPSVIDAITDPNALSVEIIANP